MNRIYFIFFIGIVSGLYNEAFAFREQDSLYELSNKVTYRYFFNQQKSLAEIQTVKSTSGFIQIDKNKFMSYATGGGELWYHIDPDIIPDLYKEGYLEFYDWSIDTVVCYWVFKNGVQKIITGDHLPFSKKPVFHKNNVIPFPPGNKEITDIYIKISSSYGHALTLMAKSKNTFYEYALKEYTYNGLYYGLVFLFSLMALVFYLMKRDIAYIFYSAYIIFFGLFNLSHNGFGFQYLWPGTPAFNTFSNELFINLTAFFLCLFALFLFREVLKNKFLVGLFLLWFGFRLIALILFIYGIDITATDYYFDMISFSIPLLITLLGYRTDRKVSALFFSAYIILIVSYFLRHNEDITFIKDFPISGYLFQIGGILEAILFGTAVVIKQRIFSKEAQNTKNLNRELERKVFERTQKLEKINDEIRLFAYRLSHDLKSPINSLKGLFEVANYDLEKEEKERIYQHMKKSIEQMENITSEVISFFKKDNEEMNIASIDLRKMIEEQFLNTKEFFGVEDFEFEIEEKSMRSFNSDPHLIRSIIYNLIENAIKYRDENKESNYLKVSINVEEAEAIITFRDNGIGMDEEKQQKVFNKFYKTESNYNSSGLGLFITKEFASKAEGKITLDSKPGKGSTFTVILRNFHLREIN